MRRAPSLLVAVLAVLLCVACVASAAGGVTSTMRVVNTQILHRHGARATYVDYNESIVCRGAPCGYLTEAGKQQLINMGAFLRERYNDVAIVDEAFFPSETYNVSLVYSRTTDVFRTLQSAEAFLHGLFPALNTSFPAIHSVPKADDLLLNIDTLPWVHYIDGYDPDDVNAALNPVTDRLYPGEQWHQLTALGSLIGAEGMCSTYDGRTYCTMDLYDIIACWRVLFPVAAVLEGNFTKLAEITRALFVYEYSYDKSDDLMARQGGRGRQFLNEAVKNLDDFISGANTYRMVHYSAHDTTLVPVWSTLGDSSDLGMLPPFAQVFVMELLKDSAASSSPYHVRILRAHPGQTHDDWSVHGFDETWAMKCADTQGQVYPAADNTCPLADFKAYYAMSAPTDPRGYCYLDEKTWAIADCPASGVSTPNATALTSGSVGAPTLSANCKFYRNVCPAYSCDAGFVVEKSTLQCVCATADSCAAVVSSDAAGTPTSTTTTARPSSSPGSGVVVNVNEDKRSVSAGATAGIAIATFCVGAIIAGAVVAGIFVCCTRRRKAEDAYRAGEAA